jgi:O-antigen ligase
VLIPLRPTLVLDTNYAGGLLPGVPRLAGLAAHPVGLGMLAQLALLCLYAQPLSQRWLNRLCWGLGLVTLFLAQSKVSWLSFPLCSACIFWMRADSPARRRFGLLALLFVTVGVGLTYIFGNLGLTMRSFLTGQQGADLASLSGRDRIWAVALGEWARHPVFGYGSDLFDEAYRADIGMPHAANSHNQFIDTLARSGLVGAGGLALYATALLLFSVKRARATRGLSLAVFLAIAFQSVSEVPLHVFQYGPDVLQHFLLLAILAGNAGSLSRVAPAAAVESPNPMGGLPLQVDTG